jgi:hypothetical protein
MSDCATVILSHEFNSSFAVNGCTYTVPQTIGGQLLTVET